MAPGLRPTGDLTMTALPPTPVLQTERLILRPLELRDAAAIQRLFDDWEVVRDLHAGIPWPYPADGALTNTVESLGKAARGERSYWAITLKGGEDQLIGRIDLWPFDPETRDMRGFWLGRPYWGRGLMTEAAERVTQYAFEDLGWDELWLCNRDTNAGSHRIKQKQGAEVVDLRPRDYVSGPGVSVTWRLTRQAWLAQRAALSGC
jgi:[ribosomal protein S5]-alanine N-acetyltransferase